MAIVTFLTINKGPGSTVPQTAPSKSLGGFVSITPWAGGEVNDLFLKAAALDVADGRPDFRCIFVYNSAPDITLPELRVYQTPGTPGAGGIALGADPRPSTYIDSLSPQAVETPTIFSPPAGVVFAQPTDYATGCSLGDLPPTSGHSLWIRRIPMGIAGAPADYVDLTFEASNGTAIVRRVYWETAPYSDSSRPVFQPPNPPNAVPTPSPFRRVAVDFLTNAGTRVTWELDSSVRDLGPYVFQLQFSHSGIAAESDWFDVGPPAADAQYLLDPEQRTWSAGLSTIYYRVILTTATGHYVSDPQSAGQVDRRTWVFYQEILRKERLMLRQFVGESGFLLRARRYGTLCSCVDPDTGECYNSSCTICYGLKYVGGVYAPIPFIFANPSAQENYEKVDYNEGLGTIQRTTIQGRIPADTLIASRDVWVEESTDARYYVHTVRELAVFRGLPVINQVEFRLAPRGDVIYKLPIVRPAYPAVPWKTVEVINV